MTLKQSQQAISIRGRDADDWEDVAAIGASANVVYHTLHTPYRSRDSVRESLENPSVDSHFLVAVVDDRVVGNLALHPASGRRAHAAKLGMMIHPDFQGRGVGTALVEAALDLAENWLNISRIEVDVYPDNMAGIALYHKLGFEIEGTLRDYAFRGGRFVDAYRMARICEEPDHE